MYVSIRTDECINRFKGYIDFDNRRLKYDIVFPEKFEGNILENTSLSINNEKIDDKLKILFLELLSKPLSELFGIMALAEDEEKIYRAARIGIGFSREYITNIEIEEFLRGYK
ncbi:hypothetical protein J4476_02580 [Candidatus Woesearchaeota archaeon]|nr:MAG: hypothetical protein QT09_C0008G0024 [archaeon GW2011_AR18]MBS3161555.1 hypothetical protein [Candidatus Woesearchaeota archaeon]HIH25651.1 hypothetical protein [Nanoarchaeota archaeon]